jgi:uncharacterized membrane protein HdeD (DUF308 family)
VVQVAEPADDWLGPGDLAEQEEPRPGRWWMIAVPIVGSVIAGGVYVLAVPAAQAWLMAAMRALS